MWNDTRRGRNLIKKRYTARKFKLNVLSISITLACVCVVVLCGLGIYNQIVELNINKAEQNYLVNIYNENEVSKEDKQEEEPKEEQQPEIYEEPNEELLAKELNITVLGELMMGGVVSDNLSYNYMAAFKTITEHTNKADYTVLNFGTNIVDIEKINDPKSEYIVNKNILNAFNALGVDGINIANDHIMDFGKDVLDKTKGYIKDYDIIGLKDEIIYAESDGIKVAIIGVCNEVIGSEGKYTSAGIMMYNLKSLKTMINEAKKNVNTVILLTHLGLENTHTVTSIMSWFYRELVDAGADVILGTHALGIYPIEIYKGKPIIYSMGYLMSDTDYAKGKETGLFNLKINEQGKLDSIEIVPLYINAKKQTVLYNEYNEKQTQTLLKYITSNLNKDTYTVKNNKVNINID